MIMTPDFLPEVIAHVGKIGDLPIHRKAHGDRGLQSARDVARVYVGERSASITETASGSDAFRGQV